MVGVVGATEVTMGMIALPAMLKRGYDQKLALRFTARRWNARNSHSTLQQSKRSARLHRDATRAFAPGYEVAGGSSGDAHSPETIPAALTT
jgi:hypothetical protein